MPLTRSNRIKQWDAIQESALVQLVYVSTLTLGSRLNTSIFEDVEAHARDYNEQHGITGTLCYGNGQFLQCIEGEKRHVFALQERIFADSRHKNIEVLLLQEINHRSFSDWRMRLLFWSAGFGHLPLKNKRHSCHHFYRLRRTAGHLIVLNNFCKLSKISTPRHISKQRALLITPWAICSAMSPRRIKPF